MGYTAADKGMAASGSWAYFPRVLPGQLLGFSGLT